MDGARWSVVSPDGTRIGCVTDGAGQPLLLIHGGMCTAQRWTALWPHLVEHFEVTAMDRRGRGASTDGVDYSLQAEVDDVRAVATALADRRGTPVDVFGHSFGALVALGAAAGASPVRRLVLFEPPGAMTLPVGWLPRMRSMIDRGDLGRVMFSFLVEVVGLSPEEVGALRDAVVEGPDPLPIVARTLVREAEVIQDLDMASLCEGVEQPVLLLLGGASQPWAVEVTRELAAQLPRSTVTEMPHQGHEAVDTDAAAVAQHITDYTRDAGSQQDP
jgi:pimeloyl-ACP methyl ester carboxylesterase